MTAIAEVTVAGPSGTAVAKEVTVAGPSGRAVARWQRMDQVAEI